ncbi:hypothetical protein HKCCE2091_21585 [Rhodobacterales bacterium HKCCE2091]|nr:hypothetical protein [Rhodobacterales bacterium HKCCE2091]
MLKERAELSISNACDDDQPLLPFHVLPEATIPQDTASRRRVRPPLQMRAEYQTHLFRYDYLEHLQMRDALAKALAFMFSCPSSILALAVLRYCVLRENFERHGGKTTDHAIVRMVPATKKKFLDRHFPSCVGHNDRLFRLSCRLASQGMFRLGDVVQLDEQDVLEMLDGDANSLRVLKDYLRDLDLSLGMAAPRWISPGPLIAPNW